jgi:hypothetical protein
MKIMLRCSGLILAVFLMVGCSGTSSTTVYSYSPPTSVDGHACVDECQQSKAVCEQSCAVPNPECIAREQAKAKQEFNEQQTYGQPAQPLEAFYHPERCEHLGCDCETNYKVCYQLCGTRTEIHDPVAQQ